MELVNIAFDIRKMAISDGDKAILQRRANKIARAAGHGRATEVVFGEQDKCVEHISSGYRKNTTDEYVSNAYRANFGWKNTYYQNACTTVQLAL